MAESLVNPKSEFRNPKSPWLILGLGNPGAKYEDTYHNVGFRVVARLGEKHGVKIGAVCGRSLISEIAVVAGQDAVLVLPQTFMNLTGAALPKLFERFDASHKDLIVVYDDVALPLGKIRIRQKGSAGGHNGVKSLISALGDDQFLRVRVGILPERPIEDVREFVLSKVARADRAILEKAENAAAAGVEALIAEGPEKAMGMFNRMDLRET